KPWSYGSATVRGLWSHYRRLFSRDRYSASKRTRVYRTRQRRRARYGDRQRGISTPLLARRRSDRQTPSGRNGIDALAPSRWSSRQRPAFGIGSQGRSCDLRSLSSEFVAERVAEQFHRPAHDE